MNTVTNQIEEAKKAFIKEEGVAPNFLILGHKAYDRWLREFNSLPYRLYDGMGIGDPRVHTDPDAVVVMRVSDEFLKRGLLS